MALSIESEEAGRLARELAETTGETMTEAVLVALRERLGRERLQRLGAEVQRLPVLDDRPPDDIIGYDHNGLPV